jgi:exosome complex exonuclease RRP6
MSLVDLTAEFVKTLNHLIPTLDSSNSNTQEQIEFIKQRITKIREKVSGSELNVDILLTKLCINEIQPVDIIYVRKDTSLRAIVSTNITKPKINEVTRSSEKCYCIFSDFQYFQPLKGYILIESEKQLREIDAGLTQVCLEIFDHDYRSYNGFSCYAAVYTADGLLYIIDLIRFRELVPTLNLLKCNVLKMIHCRKCVERLYKDFGEIGCYRNFDVSEKNLYVDWRIRPINEGFISIISESVNEIVEKVNERMSSEKYEVEMKNELLDFINEHNLPEDCPLLPELLKLRTYLAKNNDESVNYVMTDSQLICLLENNPTTVAELDSLFPRMSCVMRLHAGDFLLILQKRAKVFSLEKLKKKYNLHIELEDEVLDVGEKLKSFGAIASNPTYQIREEEHSDFKMSSDE